MGCRVTILPGTATADEVLALDPDGVFLSNGPGDPERRSLCQQTQSATCLGKTPIFGICLGHQLLGWPAAPDYKLKFGHRGANQPVLNKATGKVEITCQNHGFAVDGESLPADLEVTHIEPNDNTIEGIRHRKFRPSACSTIPRRRPVLTTAITCSDCFGRCSVTFRTSNMARISMIIGILLFGLGLGGYYGMEQDHVYSIVSAVLGFLLFGLGIAALKEWFRKHAMHAAALAALVDCAFPFTA